VEKHKALVILETICYSIERNLACNRRKRFLSWIPVAQIYVFECLGNLM